MLKRFMLVSSILLLFMMVVGCNSSKETTSQTSIDVYWPFYKVSKGNDYMYLLGSIHVGKKEMYPFPNKIKQAMEESTYLVTEVDWTELLSGETLRAMVREESFLNEGVYLDDLLTERAKEHLAALAKDYSFPYESFQNHRPWYVMFSIVDLSRRHTGLDAIYGVDNQLYELANHLEMDFKSLEEASFQYEMIQKAFPDEQADHIIKSIPTKNEGKERFFELMDAYIKGVASEIVVEQMSETEQEYLLSIRNENWLPQLEQFVQSGEVHFVAVGAGHLEGKYGLLKDLEERGYTVSKIE